MVIFEANISSMTMRHRLEKDILSGLGRAIPYILGLYLLLKLTDLGARGELSLIFSEYPINLLWWGEIAIGVVLPIILLSITKIRQNRAGLFWGATLVVAGLIFNRFNVSMFALSMRPGYNYFPHWMEVAISVALVADAMIVIWLSYRLLPISREDMVASEKG